MEVVREPRVGGEPEGDEQWTSLAAEKRCRDWHHREGEVGCRRRLSYCRDEGERQREERENAAKVVSFERPLNGPSSHTPD